MDPVRLVLKKKTQFFTFIKVNFVYLRPAVNAVNEATKEQVLTILWNENCDYKDKNVDSEFFRVNLEQLRDDTIIKAIQFQRFDIDVKPYLFYLLKSLQSLNGVIAGVIKSYYSKPSADKQFLEAIDERDLICGLIMCTNSQSIPKLGKLIAQNNYPLPIVFTTCERPPVATTSPNKLDYQLCFNIAFDLLSLTNKSLAVVSGTRNAIFSGKSQLIPVLFNGLDETKSIFISKQPFACRKNNVDLVCTEDNCCSDWVIADFHSDVNTMEAQNLLKSFGAYCVSHIINVKINDFNDDNTCSSELNELII